MKRRTTVLAALLAVTIGALALVRRKAARLDRRVQRRVDALLASAATAPDDPITADEFEDLPAPVQRYLRAVLPAEQAEIGTVHIEQRGQFRLGDVDSPWRPLAATQHVTTDPPGFVWDADIDVVPLVPAHVVDAYEDGRGSLRATLLSTVTVADAGQGPELDRGELLRYLGEAVWYPTALLPRNGVSWEPIHDRAARATIQDGETTASLTFYFGPDDLVTRVVGERPRRRDDGTTGVTSRRAGPATGASTRNGTAWSSRQAVRSPGTSPTGRSPTGGHRSSRSSTTLDAVPRASARRPSVS